MPFSPAPTQLPSELTIAATIYYVRKDGNDINPGTEDSAAGAFATIDKAVTNLAEIYGANQAVDIILGDAAIGNPHDLPININLVSGYERVRIVSQNGAANCFVRSLPGVVIFGGEGNAQLLNVTVTSTTGAFVISNSGSNLLDGIIFSSAVTFLVESESILSLANSTFQGSYAPTTKIFQVTNRCKLTVGLSNSFSISILVTGTLIEASKYAEVDFQPAITGLDLLTINALDHSVVDLPNIARNANNIDDTIDETSKVIFSDQTVIGSPDAIQGAFSSDFDAGINGVATGQRYETDGQGTGVFAETGVVMVKQ